MAKARNRTRSSYTLERFQENLRAEEAIARVTEEIPGVGVLRALRAGNGKPVAIAYYFGDEPLPDLNATVKHSVWGWRSKMGAITEQTPREGHSYDSIRDRGSFFPEDWSDADIAESILQAVESPERSAAIGTARYALRLMALPVLECVDAVLELAGVDEGPQDVVGEVAEA